MFAFFAIALLSITFLKSTANPIISNTNETIEFDNSNDQQCDRNIYLMNNQSLFELLNNDRLWFVLARTKYIYGEQTWNNALMQTTTNNGTTYLQFVGENNNGSCVSSEKAQIGLDVKPNRVSVRWSNGNEGFLEMVFLDETLTLYTFCYSFDVNQTDVCSRNQTEHFVVQNNQIEFNNETLSWLKTHCASINTDDILFNDDSRKCLSTVIEPEFVQVNATENSNQTVVVENVEEENITVTPVTEFEFTARTNRTNRVEILEEYYENATKVEQLEATTVAVEMKEIVVLSANVSVNDDLNQTNIIVIEEIGTVVEPVTNETVVEEVPFIVLHKAVIVETTTEVLSDSAISTENVVTEVVENTSSTEANVDYTTTSHSTPVIATTTEEKEVSNELTTTVHVGNDSHTTEYQTTMQTTMELMTTMETTVESTTMELTTSTSSIPADCPVSKDCPFDYCAFARKLDNRGCPTCNCLQSDKSNITCPPLTCPGCLYGHYTDPNGCPICQCQSRPYPPLGERCPQLNCDPCYFGTVKDEYNCDTCVCIRPNSQECPVLNCKYGSCKYGSTKDEDDCPTCDCLLPTDNTTDVNCSISTSCPPCHLGYVKDADGCETCQCKLRSNALCPSIGSDCHCDYGSYLNADGCETCSCLPDPKNTSRQACWELSNQANFHNMSGPICGSDGSFYGRQCDRSTSTCWCVTLTGIPITGFESTLEENVNCACAVELYQVSSLRMIGHHLLCLLNGNYAPIQCDGRYCSCVDERGTPIGPSVSVQNRNQLRCVGVYQQLHPERFLLHQATVDQSDENRVPYHIASSLCLTHREQIRQANITDEHFLIPVCDTNGLYAPVQCDQSERYCWCVDKKTGVEMEGTRRLNARPNCNLE